MIRCCWCGQESAHPQVCEWCRRDRATGALVRTLPPNPTASPPVGAPQAGTPSGGDPVGAAPTAPSSQPTQAIPPTPSPPLSSQPTQAIPTPQPAPLYDYSRPAAQAAAQQPADSIRFISEVIEGYTFTAKLERFFGVALPLAALNVLVLGWKPEWAAWSNLLFFFLVGVWLPVSHLVDKLDIETIELFRDLGIVLFLHILCCHPLFAFVFYGLGLLLIWAITRAEINWSLLGVMAIYMVLRVLFDLVLMLVDYADPADWLTVGIAFFGSLPLFAMFIGWFIGGMFRSDYA
jgi:hypothetical protein